MIQIQPTNLHWLGGSLHEQDLCAHGGVVIRDGDRVLVDDSVEEWTLSAAGLYLLRTLLEDHTSESPVGEQLFPHCGHGIFPGDSGSDHEVYLGGCSTGRDAEIVHREGTVSLRFDNGATASVPLETWRDAVVRFCLAVEAFFEASEEKVFDEGEEIFEEGYQAFWREWRRRMRAAQAA